MTNLTITVTNDDSEVLDQFVIGPKAVAELAATPEHLGPPALAESDLDEVRSMVWDAAHKVSNERTVR